MILLHFKKELSTFLNKTRSRKIAINSTHYYFYGTKITLKRTIYSLNAYLRLSKIKRPLYINITPDNYKFLFFQKKATHPTSFLRLKQNTHLPVYGLKMILQ